MVVNKNLLKMLMINKKSYVFSCIIIFISIMSLLLLLSLQRGISDMITKEINNKYINRDLIVSLKEDVDIDEIISNLENNNDVEEVYKNYDSLNFDHEEYGFLSLNGVPISYFENLKFDDDYLNDNYIIIPSCLNVDKDNVIGKKISLTYEDKSYDFVVAGIYYLDDDVMSNAVYTSYSYYTKLIESNDIYPEVNEIRVLVRNYDNVSEVVSSLQVYSDNVYLNDNSGTTEINLYEGLSQLVVYFIIAIIIFLLISFIITINIMINQEYESIAILKSLGYSNKQIYYLLLIILIVSILAIFIIASLFNLFFINAIKLIFDYSILKYISGRFINEVVVLLLIFLMLIISILFNYFKIKKVSIIKLISENE